MRDRRLDNVKALMMFCVALGHISGAFDLGGPVYQILYTFHMPVFIFISGWVARPTRRGFLSLFGLYAITQLADFLFYPVSFPQGTGDLTLRLSEPYMFQWYLMSLMTYLLLLPLLDAKGPLAGAVTVGVCFAVSVLAGFDRNIGYVFSLSRTLVYLPFFAAGHIIGSARRGKEPLSPRLRLMGCAVCLPVMVFGIVFALRHPLPYNFLYGSEAYVRFLMPPWQAAGTRALYLGLGAAWTGFFMLALPDVKIPILTRVGENTLPVFILHGYVAALLFKHGFFGENVVRNWLWAVILAALCCVLFALPPLRSLMCFKSPIDIKKE